MNHDALFKMLLKTPTILPAFFHAFLPETGRFVDFTHIEFVDKEGITSDGRTRTGDLLIKTQFRGEAAGFLIHLEHQAQPDPGLARRMLEYFMLDWQEYDLPVYPIAVLSHAESSPKNLVPLRVDFPNKRILEFHFDVIDLPRMNAELYASMPNPAALALAARMRFKKENRPRLIKYFALTLARMELSKPARDMVAAFFFAYRRFSPAEALQLQLEFGTLESTMRDRVMELTNPWIEAGKQQGLHQGLERGLEQGLERGLEQGLERGLQEGILKGRQQGEVELVLRQLCRRLGAISAPQQRAIRKLPLARIEALGEALLEFASPADLARWLRHHK